MTGAIHALRAATLRVAAAMALSVLAPSLAQAQQVSLDPSAAQRCLTSVDDSRSLPTYPFDAWKRGEKGRVVVELVFTTPDKRAAVAVLEKEGGSAFVSAVQDHVANYRVPCLETTPARLKLEFVFRPDDRQVFSSGPADAGDERRLAQLECLRHVSNHKAPEYPHQALRAELQGRVLARLRFAAADQPPEVQVLAPQAFGVFARAIEDFAKGYRLPCFEGAEPVQATITYVYRLKGYGAFGLKPLDLLGFMGRVRGIEQQTLQFDTTTMACPFDVQLQYRQPYLPNLVGEVGGREPARQPLLAWLAAQQLDLPRGASEAVFADDTVITVPCARINLKPKETS